MTAEDVISRGHAAIQERCERNGEPLYSKQRIRRRALCEAICMRFSDDELIEMRTDQIQNELRKKSAEHFYVPPVIESAKAEPISGPTPDTFPIVPIEDVFRDHIVNALKSGIGHVKASELLGIGKTTFFRKLLQYETQGYITSADRRLGYANCGPKPRKDVAA